MNKFKPGQYVTLVNPDKISRSIDGFKQGKLLRVLNADEDTFMSYEGNSYYTYEVIEVTNLTKLEKLIYGVYD